MTILPSLLEAQKLAEQHRVIPVIKTLFSGSETPLSIFEKVAADKPGSFLLESAEQGVWARYSFIGVNNRGTLTQPNLDGTASAPTRWFSATGATALPDGAELSPKPLEALAQMQQAWKSAPISDLPPLTSGLVGLIGWDMARQIENLPNVPKVDFAAPAMAFAMFQDLIIVDHLTSNLLLVSNIFVTDDVAGADVAAGYRAAEGRIERLQQQLLTPTAPKLSELDLGGEVVSTHRVAKQQFLDSVEAAKHFVRIGDVFQVVIGQRFDIEVSATPLDVYRVLRALNPSPYMYLLNFEDEDGPYAVIGSSPEALVSVSTGHAVMHPIAGSRPRGKDTEDDSYLADSLLADAKERAEHLMLVDLARNDLLKVCQPASVNVTEFMQVHRFSHIMHLVSTVEGTLREGQSSVDAFRATFPAGTLSGAPKPRALEIIDELEQSSRGIYGGVVGYFDFAGNADLAIAIRTAFLRDGVARIQAGAGLVLDSVPETEYLETIAKAGAPARAVFAANKLKHIG